MAGMKIHMKTELKMSLFRSMPVLSFLWVGGRLSLVTSGFSVKSGLCSEMVSRIP